jgi:uncharacterized protein YaiI (UPF0178 family)
MRIWVDADACPNPIKEILFRAAERRQVETVLVANQYLRTPGSRFISCLQVPAGFDQADDAIVERVAAGDLVVTADIPLASEVVAAGGTALNPRGTLYTRENVKSHLAQRDLMDTLRSAGAVTGGPPPLTKAEVQTFANALDRFLTRRERDHGGSD